MRGSDRPLIEPDARTLRPPPMLPCPAMADYSVAVVYDDDMSAAVQIAADKRYPNTLDTDANCPMMINPGLDELLT